MRTLRIGISHMIKANDKQFLLNCNLNAKEVQKEERIILCACGGGCWRQAS